MDDETDGFPPLLRRFFFRRDVGRCEEPSAAGASGPLPAFDSVDTLSQAVKEEAIAIAREILEKLKLQFSGTPFISLLNYAPQQPPEQPPRSVADLNTVIAVYRDHLERGAALDPSLQEDAKILRANDAIDFVSVQIKLRALDRAEMLGNTAQAAALRSELAGLPGALLNPNRYTSDDIFQALEQGIAMVLATLLQLQKENKGQNQRGLMLQASSRSPEELSRRQSLSFDETYQRIAAERRAAFHARISGQAAQPPPRQGGTPQESGHSAHKKTCKSEAAPSPPSNATTFDALLNGSGANLQQMKDSVNAPTSGNFDPAAPGSIQKTLQQAIAHHGKAGSAPAAKSGKPVQKQQQRAEEQHRAARRPPRPAVAQEAAKPDAEGDKKREEPPPISPAPPPRSGRNLPGRG